MVFFYVNVRWDTLKLCRIWGNSLGGGVLHVAGPLVSLPHPLSTRLWSSPSLCQPVTFQVFKELAQAVSGGGAEARRLLRWLLGSSR